MIDIEKFVQEAMDIVLDDEDFEDDDVRFTTPEQAFDYMIKGNTMRKIKINARPTRDEEGFWDSSCGIFVDIETDGTEFLKLRRLFKSIEKRIQELYPPLKFEELEVGCEERDEGKVHLTYSLDFDNINNDSQSSLFNIASLGCGVCTLFIAEEFQKLQYELFINYDKATPSEMMKDVINDLELSFFWEVVYNSCLYNEYTNMNKLNDAGVIDELIQKLKFDSELYDNVKKELFEEREGEFGVADLDDNLIEYYDYSPLRASEQASERISVLCKRIQYNELRRILKENI